MEKEYNEKKKNEKLVLELLQLYDISSAKGILAIKEMLDATEYDLLKRLGKVMFRCIENEINVLQIQELFSNYIESDMHSSKIEKKIIPNALLCIIAGERRAYLVELIISITSMDLEALYGKENLAYEGEQEKYFASKKLYSVNTNRLEELETDDETILRCLNRIENRVLVLALYGASGKTIKRFFSMLDKELARVLFEDLQNVIDSEMDEKLIIGAQLTVLNLLKE